MKMVSWCLWKPRNKSLGLKFIFSPYLSPRSLRYHPKTDEELFLKLLTFSFLLTFSVLLARHFMSPLNIFEIMLFSPAIYFLIETLGTIGQVIFYKTPTFSIHRSPVFATSLSYFWGRDWNLWVQDWLRDITQSIGRGKYSKRIVVVFFISGVFHEVMCNLPYWIFYGESYFGTMMAYFFIQAVALWIDKKVVRHWPILWRRIFLWLVVIVPSPLFINVPLLTFLGLTHD